MEIELKPFQAEFLHSQARFPAMVSSIGTGKTLMLLLKIWNFCQTYSNSLALVVRKEYTDLRDSTIKDFHRYFDVTIDSEKNFKMPNGSIIMFRHGSEINVLKNLNLSIIGIEQAEEFETEETFDFLRDRLRRQTSPFRQLCIIANARGHNWIWKRWISGKSPIVIDADTGQYIYEDKEYFGITANTFSNEDNLPADFVSDLKSMEQDAPNHYFQYVMNSFEDMEEDDYVFNFKELEDARKREFAPREGYGDRIIGFDIARYGNDKCAAIGIEQVGALLWRQFHTEQWDKKDLDYTTGRILSIHFSQNSLANIIDEDGIGAGPLDTINKGRGIDSFVGFRNIPLPRADDEFYGNPRTANAFKLKSMISKGWIAIPDEETCQELMTLRYKYMNDGRKILVSKEEMRKKGFKSPNLADALIMAVSLIDNIQKQQERQFVSMPRYSPEDNLFKIGGLR